MSEAKWHNGTPPSIGWWPAGIYTNPNEIRWWDGKCWSYAAHPSQSAIIASSVAAQKHSPEITGIYWYERWWL